MLQFHPKVKVRIVGDEVLLDEANTGLLWVASPCEHGGEEFFKGLFGTCACLIKYVKAVEGQIANSKNSK